MTYPSIPEEWRPIDILAGYEVSSLGRVRSLDRTVIFQRRGKQSRRNFEGKILKPRFDKDGYPYLNLSAHVTVKVHILVCAAFHGPKPSPDHEVAHWDGNRGNAKADNLRWATYAENREDMLRHGTKLTRERHGMAKLREADIPEIRQLLALGISQSVIGKRFGVSQTMISNIKLRYNWQ